MGIAFQRGRLLYEQKRYDLAAEEFRKDLQEFPDNSRAMAMLAMSLRLMDKLDEAQVHAQAAIAANPSDAFAHYAMACVQLFPPLRWNHSRAFQFFRDFYVRFRYLKYRRQVRKALPFAMEAVRLNPQNADYLGLVAGLEFDRHRYKTSLQWSEKGLEVHPDHVYCATLRARTLAKLGRRDEARKSFQAALALAPDSATTHASGGWTHLQSGNPTDAIKHFEESVRLNPENAGAHLGLSAAKRARTRRVVRFSVLGVWGAILASNAFFDSSPDHAQRAGAIAILGIILFVTIALLIRDVKRRRQ